MMQRLVKVGTLLALVTNVGCGSLGNMSTKSQRQASPETVVAAFFDLVKQRDTDAAVKFLAGFDSAPEWAKQQWHNNMGNIDAEKWSYRIVKTKIDGTVALVVFQENRDRSNRSVDLDPALLILDNGRWKLSPEITSYEWPSLNITSHQRNQLDGLLAWFKANKKKLQSEVVSSE